jgi:hypothetical protein
VSIYAVNGKEPIAAWIPSLDNSGNGTTTLNDLVGSNSGTLTNMDAATDWVADTGAGGVRALDFDGVNDSVSIGANSAFDVGTGDFALSVWANWPSYDGTTRILMGMGFSTSGRACGLYFAGATIRGHFRSSAGVIREVEVAVPASNQWHHLLVSRQSQVVSFFVNGALIGSLADAGINLTGHTNTRLAANSPSGGFHYLGRLDDARVFNQSMVLADAQYLTQRRGITKSGGIIPILRQHYAAQGAR